MKVYEIKTSTKPTWALFLGYNPELKKNVTIFRDEDNDEEIIAVTYPATYGRLVDMTRTLEYKEGVKVKTLSALEKELASKMLDRRGL